MSPEAPPQRLVRLLPWLVGLAGAALFLRPLWDAPATTVVDRTFWYDAHYNLDAMIAQHRALLGGLDGRGLHDWLYSGLFFFPQPRPLIVSELLPLAAVATLPLAAAPLLAHNLLYFIAILLNCVAGASFARTVGAAPISAAVAGAGFAFSAYTNATASRVQLLFLFPVAFALASLVRWARTGAARSAVATAAWTLVAAMLCLYYALFLAFVVPPVAIAARLAVRRPGAWPDLARLAGALAFAAIPAGFVLWPYRGLRADLGLARNFREVASQGGDPLFLLWADYSTLFGGVLRDVYRWDSAHYPGTVALVGSVVGLGLWLRPRLGEWRVLSGPGLVLPMLLGVALTPLVGVTAFFLGALAVLVRLVRLARAGELRAEVPALAALALGGFFLFGGPDPSAFGLRIGPSPYALLLEYAPFVDGLRMVRRASILLQLALLGVAALALTRLELRPRGAWLVAPLLLLTVAESLPLNLGARTIETTCDDPALRLARDRGIAAVGELLRRPADHAELTRNRHRAELCGVATTAGPPGFQPPLALVVEDALSTLPEPSAHGWLWEAGVRHVIVRGQGDRRWTARRVAELASITGAHEALGVDSLVTLNPPDFQPIRCLDVAPGEPVAVTRVDCSHQPGDCARLADGDLTVRWSSRGAGGGEEITLHFAPAVVSALEWRADGYGTDLPRGLRIERLGEDGAFVPWAEFPSIPLEGLGRDAVRARVVLPLPPATTSALRLVNTGKSRRFWLSATELVPRAGR